MLLCSFFFFFSSRRRHTRSLCDWSSDVCSSDLTWSRLDLPVPPREFWHETLQAVRAHFPDFCCIAEAYWGLQGRLQQLGFPLRSEERRVGKECRSRWSTYD